MQRFLIIAFMELWTAGTSVLADLDGWGHGGIVLPPPIRGPAIVLPPPPPLPRLAPLPPPSGIYRKGRYYGDPPSGYPKGQYKHHHHRH
ncbi:MAG: hypothetical protein ACOYLM_12615 [Methylococcaceae bacterium]